MKDEHIIWHAEQMTKMQARFAQMVINDLNKFSCNKGSYNDEYREFLKNKYREYINN